MKGGKRSGWRVVREGGGKGEGEGGERPGRREKQ